MPGGPKLVHLTFNIDEGPKVKIRDDRLRRQQGDQRRRAAAADEGEQGAVDVLVHHRPRHLPGNQVRGRRRARSSSTTANRGYITRAGRRARAQGRSRTRRTRRRAGSSCGSRSPRATRYRVGELRLRRQHGRQDRGAAAALQAQDGRVLQPEEDPQGLREGAGDVRRRRLLGVHRLPGLQVRSDEPNPAEPAGAGRAGRGARRSPRGRRSST